MTKKQTPWNSGPETKRASAPIGVSGAPADAEPDKFDPKNAGFAVVRSKPPVRTANVITKDADDLTNAGLIDPIRRASRGTP